MVFHLVAEPIDNVKRGLTVLNVHLPVYSTFWLNNSQSAIKREPSGT